MNLRFVKRLIKLIEESDVEEVEIKRFGRSIRIRKGTTKVNKACSSMKNPVKELQEEGKRTEEEIEKDDVLAIKAPMVGIFYRAPAPDAPPYVEIGDSVVPGQIVCIVEAMKVMNEMESDVKGTIVDILVKSDDPVEFNQKLFLVKPE
ncbi:MAG: acetyl-CoA carboxylase biotin carboxyl carrier protein [Candidatus Cloacimonadota bacterium]|nr:MAG: acetyl-CoA carboxylase biotin carboxyl carrier protein [Candidatus Cloacimonadota bacterium]